MKASTKKIILEMAANPHEILFYAPLSRELKVTAFTAEKHLLQLVKEGVLVEHDDGIHARTFTLSK